MPIDWDRVQARLSHRGRTRCGPEWRLGPEWSDRLTDFDLWFVWAGRGAMALTDRRIDLRPGTCLWMRPGRRYLAEQDPADRLGVTWVHFDLLGPDGGRIDAADLPPEVHEVIDIGYLDALLTRVAQRHEPAAALVRLFTSALMEIDAGTLGQRARDAHAADRRRQVILKAAARLREDPAAAPAVADLADAAGYSPDHFARLFRDVVGRSPQDFLVSLRIDRARQLLVESSLSVTQIADALGYRDVYFFSRQFKQRTGLSPLAFRAAPRGRER